LVDVYLPSKGFFAALPGSFQVTSYNPTALLQALDQLAPTPGTMVKTSVGLVF